jgi:two-component sensor histidine kinase
VDPDMVRGMPFWNTPWFTGLPKTQDILRDAVARAAAGETVRAEMQQYTAGNHLRTVDLSIKPLLDDDGAVSMLIPEGRDVTERKQAEERLRASLAEKEVLLQEVHHRVKNNLQIVSSLLHLQEPEDGEALPLFRESQARIRTMALVHEELYRSSDLGRIELTGYARKLIQGLHSLFGAERVQCSVTGSGDILVSMDQAVPLGLLLNELVVNAMTHAFPDGRTGSITVDLALDDGHVTLTVSDDGAGLPGGLDTDAGGGLGLQLVRGLADQLSGDLEATSGQGTRFLLRFPLAGHGEHAP